MEEKRKETAELYFQYKRLVIACEELSVDFNAFVQPVMELSRAFDHLMRIEAVDKRLEIDYPNHDGLDDPAAYAYGQEKAAHSHMLRAFFDAADWFSIEIRERIITSMQVYPYEFVKAAFPEYYSEVRTDVEAINREIAGLREKKDVGNMPLKEAERYVDLITRLNNHLADVNNRIPAIEEAGDRIKKDNSLARVKKYGMAAIIAIISGVIGWLIKGW
ncbi:MAG: hypothetical protein SWH61_05400 [Thermodesulfobacteriota bacterium]|nr:hypothetical protein [Thermodesulfobacteriota bacterium]